MGQLDTLLARLKIANSKIASEVRLQSEKSRAVLLKLRNEEKIGEEGEEGEGQDVDEMENLETTLPTSGASPVRVSQVTSGPLSPPKPR